MKTTYILLGVSFALIAGCASEPQSTQYTGSPAEHPAYQKALKKGFEELRERDANRKIASGFAGNFEGLRSEVRMMVFRKVSNMNWKPKDRLKVRFVSPVTIRFASQRLVDCGKLLKEKIGRNSHKLFFDHRVDVGSRCVILKGSQKEPERNAANMKRDDIKSISLFMDSNYRTYGMEVEKQGAEKPVAVPWYDERGLSSGLLAYPIDVPNLARVESDEALISVPKDDYVINKIKKFGIRTCSDEGKKAHRFSGQDVYGGAYTLYWCDGDAWPTAMDTQRYFAVLRK